MKNHRPIEWKDPEDSKKGTMALETRDQVKK